MGFLGKKTSYVSSLLNHIRAFPWDSHHTLGFSGGAFCVSRLLTGNIKKTLLKGQDLIKLFFSASASTLSSEAGVSEPYCECAAVGNMRIAGKVCCHWLGLCQGPDILALFAFRPSSMSLPSEKDK